nr:MAG TPA: hypothetical protein [Caudoviricetes sp.]
MVDQPPQRDVDLARHLLPLEFSDVVRDLGDDVACQQESIRSAEVVSEGAHQCMRVPVCDLLVVFDVAEREGRHGLGLEGG